MAGTFKTFRDDPQPRQFYLNGMTATGKLLGVGSYGSVMEMQYEGTVCAAKQILDIFLQAGNEGVHEIIEKYQQECQLMAGLQHPNITQFLGLCFLKDFQLPLLVMERLEMSVDDLLECASNISLPVKISILTDTSSGLVYLHSRTPPIVHRDLTAKNVLLTASLTAKITDLGNSRMVTLPPGQLAQTLTKTPGTTVYMPPEALCESHRYGPSLDVFSFGHLALFTLTQVFPCELLSSTYPNPSDPDQLIARSEVDRRQTYTALLETTCGIYHPVLLDLVRQCLHNTPERRPSSQHLFPWLCAMKSEIERVHKGSAVKQLNIASVLHVKEMKDKDKSMKKLQVSENTLEAGNSELMAGTDRMQTENRQQRANTQMLQTELSRLEQKNRDQQMALRRLEQENMSKQMALDKLEGQLQRLTVKLESEKGREETEEILHMRTFPHQPDWRCGPDMPVAMDGYVQSVEINGTVYVGGGSADRSKDGYIVMAYTQSRQWHSLSPYATRGFAMTTINSKLVLVGGLARNYSDSNELGQWEPNSNQWIQPFPPMSTPCYYPSAMSYKHWLVVAGGYHEGRLQSIEILDVSNMQWSTGPSIPTPWERMKSTTVGDTWYLMGGWCGGDGFGSPDVYSASLEALVTQPEPYSPNIWRKLPSLDCKYSCPVIIGGSLLAVGGREIKSQKPVSTIQRYVPESNTWVQVGLIPHAVYACTCIMTADNLHIMGGYNGKTRHKELFTCTYY